MALPPSQALTARAWSSRKPQLSRATNNIAFLILGPTGASGAAVEPECMVLSLKSAKKRKIIGAYSDSKSAAKI